MSITKIFPLFVVLAIGMTGCAQSSAPECPTITIRDWHKDQREAYGIIEAYGAVYDTYIEFTYKTNRSNNFSHKQKNIYCPAPHETKGCRVYTIEMEEDAGTLLKVKDHQGERFYKVSKPGKIKWDGSTFRCPS